MSLDLEGGTLDGFTLRVSSLPTLVPGERAVFFLDGGNGGYHAHLKGQGILKLDERVADTIKEWRSDDRKKHITIRQLLDFTSGLEPMWLLHGDAVPDRNAVALRRPIVARPGDRFIYGPSSLQVFDELFRRKLSVYRETPTQYLERKVLRPLGLGPQEYKRDRAGNPLLATGFRLTAEQWSRMGRLIAGIANAAVDKAEGANRVAVVDLASGVEARSLPAPWADPVNEPILFLGPASPPLPASLSAVQCAC